MNPLVSNIIIQIFSVIGTILFLVSFQFKKNTKLFFCQAISYVFYVTHFMLLGAYTAGASYIINLIRSICLSSTRKLPNSKLMCAILCLAQISILSFTWNGWISILPVVANIASTIAGYSRNPKKIRVAGIAINAPLFIVYDLIVGSYAGAMDELITEISMIVSVKRFGWDKLNEVQ